MAILFFVLPLLFATAQSQYLWTIPCQDSTHCANVMGVSGNYQCNQGLCLCANYTTHTYELCSNRDMMLTATKISGLRRNCTEDADCNTVVGATCVRKDPKDKFSKICLCNGEMVESEDGQKCLTAAKKIGDECDEKAQCVSRLQEGAECVNRKCRCRPTHHFMSDKCVRNLGYGDHCKPDEDGCYEKASAEGGNLLTCTETYGCRCKKHWTYNERSQHCEYSGASQLAVQFGTMFVLILLAALF